MLTKDFDEEVDGFEVRKFIIIGIYTDAEVETSITAVDDFVVTELMLFECRPFDWSEVG